MSVTAPKIDAVASAVATGYNRSTDLSSPDNGVVRIQVTPIAFQVRALATWSDSDATQRSVAIVIESSIPIDLTNIRPTDRFGDANDLLRDAARDVQRVVGRDVTVHAISSTYATSALDDRPFILHLEAVIDAHGVGHTITNVGDRPLSVLGADVNDALVDETALAEDEEACDE